MQHTWRVGVRRPLLLQAVAAALACATVLAGSQESKSAALAKELSEALDGAKLDGIAAADPSKPGSFVAALYIPGTQLLVVSATYAAPALLVEKINARDFRGLYMDLHSASVPGSKIFVQDQRCDGLIWRPGGDDVADMWDEGAKSTAFDGEWKKAKITEEEYIKAYTEADDQYARLLSLLLAQTKQLKAKAGS
jgi:hypothetical protein